MFFNKVFLTIIYIFLFIIFKCNFIIILKQRNKQAFRSFDDDIVLEVKKGANSEQIFQLLKKYNIVQSRIKYNYLVYAKGSEYLPKYGQYLIPKYSSLNSILDIFNSGESIEYKITIPEGLTTRKIFRNCIKR